MKALLHPTYFPNIATMAVLIKYEAYWETHDNFQKQTHRNRTHICTDIGKHLLTIPIQHVGGSQGRQKTRDVKLDNSGNWQRQHWRTLQTAYRTSAFFEYYEDELAPLFHREFKFLLDLNLNTIAFLTEATGVQNPEGTTATYQKDWGEGLDCRFLVNAKKIIELEQPPYFQVFGDRHGFVKNTSTLDVLFNQGPSTVDYLSALQLSFKDA
ncbi:MAG: hypothetical protein HKP24_01450 [Croceitalea sp.]|nr:WbqC family protein [Croceitalea sp.]NNC35103.1 hypothetical protein [Croceitalea sp.]NNM17211.1 hypothetical protein [Croceitalea sp.]